MTKVAIIRCEKNMDKCPMTNCFKCLTETKEGFAEYDKCIPVGVFTCRCPGDNAVGLAKILKSKGAEVIHFCTCAFANKTKDGWDSSKKGFCENLDEIIERVNKESGLRCVKGTAHLPKGYTPEIWE
ncbi:MAG: CGGC domain-containing protein [Thermodesulfobacteriota bacterium]|nr:CGGC domain-containing protein [Thermodesulfobacteriota bacterium]